MKEKPRPALSYLRELIPVPITSSEIVGPDEICILKTEELLEKFIKKMEKKHRARRGHDPADRNRYCRSCASSNESGMLHPCETLKAVRELLGTLEES